MKEIGIVKETIEKDNEIKVLVNKNPACGSCSKAGGFCKPLGEDNQRIFSIKVNNVSEFKIGDKVELIISEKTFSLSLILLFFFPTLLLILSLYVFLKFFKDEGISVLISLLNLGLYYMILRMFNKRIEKKIKIIVRKIE